MRKAFLLIVLVMLAAVPVAAQEELPAFIADSHTACEVDLTGQTVTIYHFGDISASFAFITQPLLAGLQDAIAYYNARGGICGAQIASDNRDTAGDPAQAQAAYDYYSTLEDKPDMLVLYSSADSELLRGQLAEDEIPVLISAGSVEGLYGQNGDEPGWIFATNPLYVDQLGSFCDFVAANPEMYPEPVIGYISWAGAFGQAAFKPETIAYCASVGVEILDTPEQFLPTATDITTNVQNLVDNGANILYTNSLASGPALVAKTIVDLGIEEDVQLAGVNWAIDTSVALLGQRTLGSDGLPSTNGLVASLPFSWYSERQLPGIQLILEQAEANGRTLPQQNISYILGWLLVDQYKEIYAQAVNSAGSLEAVDGALLKSIVEGISYSPLGLFDFSYGEGMRSVSGNRLAMMYYLNAEMTGPATSAEDALLVDTPDGGKLFVPLIVPVTEFAPAPDLRPGMVEME
ncbi:MAG: ABC transporter substrate-binding protein [Anaerolineae bacterium]|nr:ABC transporter substrate-binding protein [Anaerolineae bacterium]